MSGPTDIALHAVAGHAIGTGHFGRSVAVAEALAAQPGVRVTLVTTQEGAALARAYFPEAIGVLALPDGSDMAARALDALASEGRRPAALYLDRYGVAPDWESAAAGMRIPLVVLDDLAEASEAPVILRPLPDAGAPRGPATRVMDGPAWLPLSRHTRGHIGVDRPEPEGRPCANLCFGGSDPTGETPGAVAALAPMDNLALDVVIGPGTHFAETAFAGAAELTHVSFHHAPDQAALAKLLSEADLALGAGGVMLWERLALGVPSLVITVADNQRPQTDWLAERGAIRHLGHAGTVTPDEIAEAVRTLIDDPEARRDMARKGRALVDGRGAIRIAALLRSLTLTARPASSDDARALYDWRTDPANWQFNRSDAPRPAFDDHLRWLDARLADPDCVFLVIEAQGTPVGVVRFDIRGGAATLSIYLVPSAHGRRLGLPVYMAGEAALLARRPDVTRIESAIHIGNGGSRRLHEDAGFALSPAEEPDWLNAEKPL